MPRAEGRGSSARGGFRVDRVESAFSPRHSTGRTIHSTRSDERAGWRKERLSPLPHDPAPS